ncbi:helix-turn-helix domain-containing protein [Lederbergia panacisoli]|uniref:helix-turn-helix domain-containing protein n=1 Tax=Lederbergia panacisoli TaxID=1255251 RepID=UPI00214C243F|nr:helix-turn-helix transcriptional regulator [Lederbergia panacisoli]MCR2821391.1 helix-turn-helix domain-containing protein [Lederbergia panacisoli]
MFSIETLGERIKELRKQKKMTLEGLAGTEITKGMLSLIENNKARPSIESLTYIAERLDVDTAVLLGAIPSYHFSEVLEEVETLYNIEFEQKQDEYKKIISIVEPILDKLNQGYESARLLEIISRCLYHEGMDGWQQTSDKAAKLYDQMNIAARRAEIGLFRAMVKFSKHEYAASLEILLREREEIKSKYAYIDPMTQVDLDFHEAILQYAVGDSVAATRIMEMAIDFSKKHRIFYRIDDLYRVAAGYALMFHDEEKRVYYLGKLKQYGEFADDPYALLFCDLLNIEYLISVNHDYKAALEIINENLKSNLTESYSEYFFLEKGKALCGLGQYEEGLHWLNKIQIPSYVHHPFDLSILYAKDAYKALCHMKLGNLDEALKLAEHAVKIIAPLPDTPYKKFSFEAYELVKAELRERNAKES